MFKRLLIALFLLLIPSASFAYNISGTGGIVLNSGDVKYLAKRELILSNYSFEDVYDQQLSQKPQNIQDWLKYHKTSNEFINFSNNQVLASFLQNGFKNFNIKLFNKNQIEELSSIPELKQYVKRYKTYNSWQNKIFRGTAATLLFPVDIMACYGGSPNCGFSFRYSQDSYQKFIQECSAVSFENWLNQGYYKEYYDFMSSSLEETKIKIIANKIQDQKTDFKGNFKFTNIKNGNYYITTVFTTNMSDNELFWDVPVSVKNNDSIKDLENDNLSGKVLQIFKTLKMVDSSQNNL